MPRQYKREATLIIGNRDSINIPNALKITGLRITFNIEKDIFGIPNKAVISVYNLSENSRNRIDEEYTKVVLNAGYEGAQKLLFAGNIMFVYNKRNNKGDYITEMHCGDGHFAYTTKFYNKNVAKNVSREEIFKDVVKEMGLQVGEIEGFTSASSSTRGQSFSAPAHYVLQDLSEQSDLWWSIQNEQVVTFKKDGNLPGQTIVFSQINGMTGSPTVTEIGVNLNVLLNADLRPGNLFKVDSVNPNIQIGNYYFRNIRRTLGEGTYRINRLVHTGDTHGDSWTTSIDGFLLI